jgi:hypothetical protein
MDPDSDQDPDADSDPDQDLDADPDQDPDADPDPAIFVMNLQDANKKQIFQIHFVY